MLRPIARFFARPLRQLANVFDPRQPRRSRRPKLTAKQFRGAAFAALRTSADLLKDAELLQANGRHLRAYAIAMFAVEELGKATLCIKRAQEPPVDDSGWVEFWDTYQHHRRKWIEITNAIYEHLELPLPSNAQDIAPEASAAAVRMRERALYSEVHGDGRALTPRGLIDPGGFETDRVAAMIAGAREMGRTLALQLKAIDET